TTRSLRMMRSKRLKAGLILLVIVMLTSAGSALLPGSVCPAGGAAVTPGGRVFARLKNRTEVPGVSDFDSDVSLEAMLRPGVDQGRWPESRAGGIGGCG